MHPAESENEALMDVLTDNILDLGATPMLFFHRVLWARKVVLGASQCILNGIHLILDAKITPKHPNVGLDRETDGWRDTQMQIFERRV